MPARPKKNLFVLACVGSLLVAVTFLASQSIGRRAAGTRSLTIFCAAGLQQRIEPLLQEYQATHGWQLETRYAGSGQLISALQLEGAGDLFIGADAYYNRRLESLGLGEHLTDWIEQTPTLAISKQAGLAASIQSVADLREAGLRLSLAKPDQAAIGHVVQNLLTPSIYQTLLDRAIVTRETVTQVLGDIRSGVADAGFVWNTTSTGWPDVVLVDLPQFSQASSRVAISVLHVSENPTAAKQLAIFLAKHGQDGLE